MSRWPRIFFCIIWIVSAFAFAVLSYEAYKTKNITLSRFSITFPKWGTVKLLGIDVNALAEMSETNNKNVAILEDSIRQSAATSLWLNLMSCIAAFVGFSSQITIYYQERRANNK